MSMYTAQCIVVSCDVGACNVKGEMLARAGAANWIPGWLEVFRMGEQGQAGQRKFICPQHAALLELRDWEAPAEIPLSQAMQSPRFQNPGAMAFMAALDPKSFGQEVLRQGGKLLDEATKRAGELPAAKE